MDGEDKFVDGEDKFVGGETASFAGSSSESASESAFPPLLGRHGFVFFSGFFLFLEGASDFLDFYIDVIKD